MGILTLTEFRADAQTRTRRIVTDLAYLDRLINAAYLEVAVTNIPFKELDKSQSITTVASTASYALPPRWYFYQPEGGRITTVEKRGRLRPMTRREFLGKTDFDAEGIPTRYHPFGTNVILYVTPDDIYAIEIDYRERPAVLTAGLATVIPEEWDEALILGTIYRIYQSFQEHSKFVLAKNDFVDYVRGRTPSEDEEDWSDTPLQVATTEADLEVQP